MTAEKSRKVLVTGGAGFIGSHVADAYLARGDEVWIVDDLSSGKRDNLPADARFHEMSVEDPAIRDLFREVGFDLVSHHAAQIDVRKSVSDPIFDARVNLIGLLNLAEAAVEVGTKRVVFVSSGGVVYGEADQIPTPETAPKRPDSPYGVSKMTGEYYLRYYRRIHGLESVALRYSNVYGPRQDPHGEAGVVAIFSNRLERGEPLIIFGDGEQTRDYVFVGDVVAANMKVSDMDLPRADDGTTGTASGEATGEDVGGEIGEDTAEGIDTFAFNVGTQRGTSVNELADHLEAAADRSPGREHRDARPGELRHNTLAIDKLRSRGWAPETTLEDGLRMTYRHIVGEKTTDPSNGGRAAVELGGAE